MGRGRGEGKQERKKRLKSELGLRGGILGS